jgi:hypothetical protein
MRENSFTSLIILLVLFFVLPSLFKLMGQYTLGSKGLEKREQEDREAEEPMPRQTMPGHPERFEPTRSPGEDLGPRELDNRPIHPKWF